jgi:hypothetical protein
VAVQHCRSAHEQRGGAPAGLPKIHIRGEVNINAATVAAVPGR